MKTPLERRDKSNYHCFHYDYGHDMEDYHNLNEQIKELIIDGNLGGLSGGPSLVKRHINVIIGGPTSRGEVSLDRKAYTQAIIEKYLIRR